MLQYLVFVGAAVSTLAAAAYIRDTLAGRTKPNRITWLMWSIAPLIAFSAGLAAEVGPPQKETLAEISMLSRIKTKL